MFILRISVLSLLVAEHILQRKYMNFIMMPCNITFECGSYFSCYKTERNITEH